MQIARGKTIRGDALLGQVGLAVANDSDQSNTYVVNFYDASGNVNGSLVDRDPTRFLVRFL